jgi:hypothetical protein
LACWPGCAPYRTLQVPGHGALAQDWLLGSREMWLGHLGPAHIIKREVVMGNMHNASVDSDKNTKKHVHKALLVGRVYQATVVVQMLHHLMIEAGLRP